MGLLAGVGFSVACNMKNRSVREIRISARTRAEKVRQFDRPGIVGYVQLTNKCRCGSNEFVDIAVHGGATIRRDCARCNRFRAFVQWNGFRIGAVATRAKKP